MSLATPYPTQLDFRGKRQIARWRPLVQWLLAIPQLVIAYALFLHEDYPPFSLQAG